MRWSLTALVLALMVALSVASGPIGAWAQSASPETETTVLNGTITVIGLNLLSWLDDDVCIITFSDYDPTPDLIVTDEEGVRVAALPLASLDGKPGFVGTGNDRRVDSCTAEYSVQLPELDLYRLRIDPYYSASLTRAYFDQVEWKLEISIRRDKSDPAPDIHDRPAGPIPGTENYLIAGTFKLVYQESADGRPNLFSIPILGCSGVGGHDDIQAGLQINITNEAGTIIAVTRLEPLFTKMDECQFIFSAEVPEAAFYTFNIGRRGSLTYSRQEMEATNWHVDFVIGN